MQSRKRLASVALESDVGDAVVRSCPQLAQTAGFGAIFVPDDILRLIMKWLSTEQPKPKGMVLDPDVCKYIQFQKELRILRTVNKQWARVGGELIRWLHVPYTPHFASPVDIPRAFPYAIHVKLERCILGAKDAGLFADAIKAFAFRPKDRIYASLTVHKTTENFILDCHGIAINFDACNHIAGCEHSNSSATSVPTPVDNNDVNLQLINVIAHECVFAEPKWNCESFMLRAVNNAAGSCYALQQNLPVLCSHRMFYYTKPPTRFASLMCAPLLEIEVYDKYVKFRTLMDWLNPRLWRNGVLPKVQIYSAPRLKKYITAITTKFMQKHQIDITMRLEMNNAYCY